MHKFTKKQLKDWNRYESYHLCKHLDLDIDRFCASNDLTRESFDFCADNYDKLKQAYAYESRKEMFGEEIATKYWDATTEDISKQLRNISPEQIKKLNNLFKD